MADSSTPNSETRTVTLTVEMTFEVSDPDAVVGKALKELVPANVSPEVRNAEITRVREDLRRAVVWNVDWSNVVDGENLALAGLEFVDLEAPGENADKQPDATAREVIAGLAAEQQGLEFMRGTAPEEMRKTLEWELGEISKVDVFIGALAWAVREMDKNLDADIALLRQRPAEDTAQELKVVGGMPLKSWSAIDVLFAERYQATVREIAAAMRSTWQGTPTIAHQLAVAMAVQQVQRPLGLAKIELPGSWFTWQRDALFTDMSFTRLLEPGFDGEAAPKGLGLRVAEWFDRLPNS